MSYKLNFSYKNEKENSIKLLLLEHHLNNQNVKKKDKLSVYNSLYLKDKVDSDKVTNFTKTISDIKNMDQNIINNDMDNNYSLNDTMKNEMMNIKNSKYMFNHLAKLMTGSG